MIDLVMCCDCLDAATDTVGRIYSRGKTLDEYLEEVREDINFLLQKEREHNYQDTYELLKKCRKLYDG